MSPRARVLYLIAVAAGVFLVPSLPAVAGVLILQVALCAFGGLRPAEIRRQLTKLSVFGLFLVVTYALTAQDPATDRWMELPLAGFVLSLNVAGALEGVTMVLRIFTIVLASQLVRLGDPRAVAAGLRGLGAPRMASSSIDAVLALLGGAGGGGGGGGRGGGRGRRRHGDAREEGAEGAEAGAESFWQGLRRLASGDVGVLVGRLERQIARAEDHVRRQGGEGGPDAARDVAVIAGVTLTMLGIKMLTILPAIPFAPGHKLVVLTPLYIVAGLATRTRFGATATGATMGTVAFLMGDGRYGIFEILKHVTPGVICDLVLPAATAGGRVPGPVFWSLFGGFVAAGRFATIFAIVLLAQAPAIAYAILLPGLAVHVTFGVASGYVSYHLVRAIDRLGGAGGEGERILVALHKKEIA